MVKVSLVICTYNRAVYLPNALKSIQQQTAKPNLFEVVIVDNNSTDNTALVAKEYIDANPGIDCRYCFENKKGLSFARNRGIEEARHEVISYIDDDAILVNTYID